MNIIEIRSIEDWNKLPGAFDNDTRIDIYCGGIEIQASRKNGRYVLRENSHAVLRENSHAELWENSHAKTFGKDVVIEQLRHNSVLICEYKQVAKNAKRDKTAQIIIQKEFLYSKKSYLDIYPADQDGFVTLYKITRDDGTDHYTGRMHYEDGVECPDWNPDPKIQCGQGLHLSPTEQQARRYAEDGPAWECKVHVDDFVVYPHDITKVRCRKIATVRPAS